jgi:hypothetical protein
MKLNSLWLTALVGVQALVIVSRAHAGFIITVPEPTTLTLLGAGAAVVAVGAWWRHRK